MSLRFGPGPLEGAIYGFGIGRCLPFIILRLWR